MTRSDGGAGACREVVRQEETVHCRVVRGGPGSIEFQFGAEESRPFAEFLLELRRECHRLPLCGRLGLFWRILSFGLRFPKREIVFAQ